MGRVNKPLSAIEKRQMRQLLQDLRKRMIEERKAKRGVTQQVVAEANVVDQAAKVVRHMKFVTPSMLADKMEISIGVAKRVLRDLETRGVLKLYAKNRRVQVYVPADKFEKLVKPGAYSYTVEEM
ncbi:30S ribosomal protein S25 [Ignicoccus pacificus DSM 13166]|uniref:30S ribosomal protein S25 n=1 Tax=Ignicoccus pacificus DSM 13166 TaxID=940294 RepID=A0A977PK64_9CREN|nr:30S ribosomal protein S25 [Ignicoccus pacificus DSM 13166]